MPDQTYPVECLSLYEPGDFPDGWQKLVMDGRLEDLEGVWEILPDRSDTCDEIMAAMGIGSIKRGLLRRFKTRILIRLLKGSGGAVKVHITTCLPMGVKKEGVVDIDGGSIEQADSDTGVTWRNNSIFRDGRLLQYRTSELGVMYDIRAVFSEDPENRTTERPLQLFRWTFVDKKGKKQTANRWMKKVEEPS